MISYIIGIETTCDETAIAIIDDSCNIVSHIVSSQIIHAEYGGVVPEIAAREHLNNISCIMDRLFEQAISPIILKQINAIGVSTRPGLIGGVLVGTMFAKAFACALRIPFISIDHLEAHILMPLMSNSTDAIFPSLVLLLSGGHCQIIKMSAVGVYQLIGQTIDDSIGETFDKIAKMLGFDYPGGPKIEKYAQLGDCKRFKLPMPLCGSLYNGNLDFSFSGLKTAMKILIDSRKETIDDDRHDICASFQYTISKILIHKIKATLSIHSVKSIIISGGVAANQYIKSSIEEVFAHDYSIIFPPTQYATDNGVMIAHNALLKYKRGQFEPLDCKVLPYSELFF